MNKNINFRKIIKNTFLAGLAIVMLLSIILILLLMKSDAVNENLVFILLSLAAFFVCGLYIVIKELFQNEEKGNAFRIFSENRDKLEEKKFINYSILCLNFLSIALVFILIYVASCGFFDIKLAFLNATSYPVLFSVNAIFSEVQHDIVMVTLSKSILLVFSCLVLYGYYIILRNCIKFFSSYDTEKTEFTLEARRFVSSIGMGFLFVGLILSSVSMPFDVVLLATPEIFNRFSENITEFSYFVESGPTDRLIKIEFGLILAGTVIVILSEFMRHGLQLEEEIEGTV